MRFRSFAGPLIDVRLNHNYPAKIKLLQRIGSFMAHTLLHLGGLMPAEMALLETEYEVIRLAKESDPEGALQQHRLDIKAIVTSFTRKVSRQMIEGLPNLEIICQFGVGVDNIDLQAASERHVNVINTPDLVTADTADLAMGLVLACARRMVEGDAYVRVNKWLNGPMPMGVSLTGKTIGIVGLGRIGQAVARRAEAFGMQVAYTGRRKKGDFSYAYHDDILKLAEASDFMVLTVSGGADTKHMINFNVLKALGPQGWLINVARGTVVDEAALLVALNNGDIAGAGLDVFADEPHVPEEFFAMDNVVLLPHVGTATIETRTKMGQLVLENLNAHFSGKPLITPVVA